MNSIEDVFPQPGTLILSAKQTVFATRSSTLSQSVNQSLVRLHQKLTTSGLFTLASIWFPPLPGTKITGWRPKQICCPIKIKRKEMAIFVTLFHILSLVEVNQAIK